MPEVIDGVTYPTTPKGRPYPTAASPGKALWQLLERAMRELDDFETYELADLAAQVSALAALVTSSAPQRRMLRKTAQQSFPTNNGAGARITWVRDTEAGDPDNPATGQPGITMASDGLFTVATAGLYLVNLDYWKQAYFAVHIRKQGIVVAREHTGSGSGPSHLTALVNMTAGQTLDVYGNRTDTNSGGLSWPYPFDADTGATGTTSYSLDRHRTLLSIVRLGA